MASQNFASAYKLVAAPVGGVFTLQLTGTGNSGPRFNVSVTDVNATGTDTDTNVLGNVANDGITTTGFNNENAQYWGTATVTSNGVATPGIIIFDSNGGGSYWFLSGASSISSVASTTAAQSSAGTNTWTLAGTGTPAAPTFAVADNVGSIQSSNLAAGSRTDDADLTLSGTAGAGATVRIYDGATTTTPIGTVVASASGTWTFTTGALSQGAHTLNVTQTETGGVTSTATAFAVTVDTTAPSAPTVGSMTDNAGTVTGTVSANGVTDDTTPTLNISLPANAVAGDTVRVFNGASEIGSRVLTAADISAQNVSVTTSAVIGDGTKTLTATITDAAGNTSGTGSFSYTLDTTPPAAPVIGAVSDNVGATQGNLADGGITDDTTLTVSGNGVAAGATVQVLNGSTVVGTTTAAANGTWSATTSALSGSVSLTARATDAAGNQSTGSAAFTATIDAAAPTVTGVTYGNQDGALAAGETVTLTVAFSESVTVAGGTPTLSLNSSGTATYTGGSGTGTLTFSYTPAAGQTTSDLAVTGFNLNGATVRDAAGNNADTAGAATNPAGTLAVDTAAPVVPTITGGAGLTNDATPVVSGTAEAGATVRLYEGATELGTTTANGSGAWSIESSTALGQGAHTLVARATDAAGNTSGNSADAIVTVDSVAPAVTSIAASGAGITNGSGALNAGKVVTLTVNASEALTVTGTPTLALNSGGTATYQGGSGTGALTFTYTVADGQNATDLAVTALNLPSGAAIRDTAGNAVTLNVGAVGNPAGTLAIDTAAPGETTTIRLASDTGASSSDGVTSNPALTGTGPADATIVVKDGTTVLGTATADGSGAWSFTPTGPAAADGAHSYTAQVADAAGNLGPAGAPLSVTVDKSTPTETATIALATDTGAAGDGVTSGPALSGTGPANATIVVKDGDAVVGTATADANGDWTLANAGAADGAHSYTAQVADAAGNLGPASAPLAVTLDTAAPAETTTLALASDTGAPGDGVTIDPSLSGTVSSGEAGVLVTILDGSTVVGTATTGEGGAWAFANASAGPGGHSYTARVTDAAGNLGPASGALAVDFDRTGDDDLSSLATPDADAIAGEGGSDTIDGAAGDDTLWGDDAAGDPAGDGGDSLTGGDGDDLLEGGGGADVLAGGPGVDTVRGGAGDDTIEGAAGDDAGDVFDGGDGRDEYSHFGADGVVVDLAAGTTSTGATLSNIEDVWTDVGNDLVRGDANANRLRGWDGDDTLEGAGGADSLEGQAGADSLSGGGDDDTLEGGEGADTLVGGDGNDVLSGGAGNDSVSGGDGDDRVVLAGGGNDTLDGGTGADTFVFSGDKAGYGVVSATDAGGQYFLVTDTDLSDGDDGTAKIYGAETLEFADAVEPVCFYPGTLVATPSGERPVETLRAGDPVLTAGGEAKPIRWLGRQTVSTRFGDPLRVLPVRIMAGALGEGLPARDLLVSPDHALLVDGVLAQAGALVNGATVRREAAVPEVFTYWHVELADHALVLAEGVAAETFIDNVARLAFDNWDEHEAAADPAPMAEMAHPRAKSARQVPLATRRRLAERAAALLGQETAAA